MLYLSVSSHAFTLVMSAKHSVSLPRLLECTECRRSPKRAGGPGSDQRRQRRRQSDVREPEPGEQTGEALLHQPALPAAGALQGQWESSVGVLVRTNGGSPGPRGGALCTVASSQAGRGFDPLVPEDCALSPSTRVLIRTAVCVSLWPCNKLMTHRTAGNCVFVLLSLFFYHKKKHR